MHAFYGIRIQSLSERLVSSISWSEDGRLLWSEHKCGIRVIRNITFALSDVVTVALLDAEVTSLGSISDGQVILAGTADGRHMLWTQIGGLWSMQSSSERLNTSVLSICVDPTGSHYSVLYDTGTIEIRIVNGNLLSSWTCVTPVSTVAWSLDGSELLCAMTSGEVLVMNSRGEPLYSIPIVCLSPDQSQSMCIGISVYGHMALIGFANGRAQICFLEKASEFPILLDTQSLMISCEWSPSGVFVALLCENNIQFYSGEDGQFIYSLLRPSSPIRFLKWSPLSDSLAVVSGTFIYLVHVSEPTEHSACCVQTGPRTAITFLESDQIREENCQDNIKFIRSNLMNDFVVITSKEIFFSQNENIIEWFGNKIIACDYIANKLFVTDGLVISRIDSTGLIASGPKCLAGTDDDGIVDIAGVGSTLAVARDSGLVQIIVNETVIENFLVETVPRRISWNCDGSLIALMDSTGGLWVGTSAKMTRVSNRDHVIDLVWARDAPDRFVCLDKHRLYVVRVIEDQFKSEEPISGPACVLQFTELELIVWRKNDIERIRTKGLRDMDSILALVNNRVDTHQMALDLDHPVIWDMLAESILRSFENDYKQVEECFIKSRNHKGLELLKKLTVLTSAEEIRLEILLFYNADSKELEECVAGNNVLLLTILKRTQQWERVLQIDPSAIHLNVLIAEDSFEKRDWVKAVQYWEKSGSNVTAKYIEALIESNEYQKLANLVDRVSDPDLLDKLGRLLLYSGMEEAAARAYVKIPKRSASL